MSTKCNIKVQNIKYIQAHTFSEWCQECGCIHLDEVTILYVSLHLKKI